MKKIAVNLLLWLLFSLMQSGPVVGTLEYGVNGGPLDSLWLMLPFSLLCLALVLITTYYAVPRLLLQRKLVSYASLEFSLSFIISFIEQLLVVYIWTLWDIMPPGHNLNWGWLLVNTLCNSLMLFFTLLAVGGWYIFNAGRRDLAKESVFTRRIEAYISAVKNSLRPDVLSNRLQNIADIVTSDPTQAEKDIADLASDLRDNLYNLPLPPALDDDPQPGSHENSKFDSWITSRRFRGWRVIIFQLSLIGICFGAFFATPDQPEFANRFGGFLVLLAMFEFIAAVDIFILFRSFRKKRRLGRFIFSSGVLAAIVILPILVERILLFINHPYNETLFTITTILATAASVLMIVFYVAGISAVLLYQDWVNHSKKLLYLRATHKRLEYANLKKQINPHFLFNILNNAGILTKLNPAEAKDMLLELRRLLDYQFGETECPTASLVDTISFLRAYLSLEATRRNVFGFSVVCKGNPENVSVPSLIFIPFVENAVKFAAYDAPGEKVKVSFILKDSHLIFECVNPVDNCSAKENSNKTGGIGIANTLRRLRLLYNNEFLYRAWQAHGFYNVFVDIPLGKGLPT